MNKEKVDLLRSKLRSTAPVAQKPEALFKSVRAALSFAYAIQHFPIASSPKLGPTVGASGRMAGMSPQEKHAQGALIRRMAEQRLHGIEVAVAFAFHGTGAVRVQAIREVSCEVAKVVRRTGLGMALCEKYFAGVNESKSQAELSREFGLSQQMVSVLFLEVSKVIGRMLADVEYKLEAMFVQSGIAEGV